MEITTQNVPETPPKPQHITVSADAWTFDPANPTAPVLMTHSESSRVADVVAWVANLLKNHWHEILLMGFALAYIYAVALPIQLGKLYPVAAIPAYVMDGVLLGIAFQVRTETKSITAWFSLVGMMMTGFLIAGVSL